MIKAQGLASVGYVRISTEKQGIDGLSVQAQKKMIDEKARELGLELSEIFIEVESGSNNCRPEFLKCVEHAKKIKGTIIVATMSRLTRNFNYMSHLAELSERWGIGIVACDIPQLSNPAQTKFIWRIMAAVAEMELETIKDRTAKGLASAKRDLAEKGFYITKEKKVGGKTIPSRKIKSLGNPRLSEVRAKGSANMKKNARSFAVRTYPIIAEIEKTGITSLRGIAKCLQARGIDTYQNYVKKLKLETPEAPIWRPEQVKRIINLAT